MRPDPRIRPLLRLLEPGRQGVPGDVPWIRRRGPDPQSAWAARVSLDRARVELRPEDADAWWRLAMGLHATGRHVNASAAFLKTLRRDLHQMAQEARQSLLVITPSRGSLDMELELAAELAGSDLALHWVCTQPVVFDAVRRALGSRGGSCYRIDPAYLDPFLRDTAMPAVGAAIATTTEALMRLPKTMTRIRLPQRFVEDPAPQVREGHVVLAPTRIFARRWTAARIGRVQPVRWPTTGCVATSPAEWERNDMVHEDTGPKDVVLRLDAGERTEVAWSDEAWISLVDVLLTELPQARVHLSAVRPRQAEALRAWRRQIERSAAWRDRVVQHFGPLEDRLGVETLAVVTEASTESVVRALRPGVGPPVVPFDPRAHGLAGLDLEVSDTAWRVLTRIHAIEHDDSEASRRRDALRAQVFWNEDVDGLSDALTGLLAKKQSDGHAGGG